MSTKGTRSGGKYGGTHTTVTPAAGIICDIAEKCNNVTKISVGYISPGLRPVSQRRVKIIDEEGGLLLSVRDSTTHQEVRMYADDVPAAKLAIARGARDAGMTISFGR